MKATIQPGPCRLETVVHAKKEGSSSAALRIETQCGFYKPLETELTEVEDVYSEIFAPLGESEIFALCKKYAKHATCPVPTGILKAVEAACRLALPTDVTIRMEKEEGD